MKNVTKKLLVLATIVAALMIIGCPQKSEPKGPNNENNTNVPGNQNTPSGPGAPKTFRVSFNSNGGTGTMDDQIFIENEEQSLKPVDFTKENHWFAGWAESKNGEAKYTDKAKLTPTSNMTLYAVWDPIPTYTVTFNANDGSGEMAPQVFTHGVAQSLKKNTFTYEGYTFNGWARSQDGSKEYDDEESISITSNMNLYALWKFQLSSISATKKYTGEYSIDDEITNDDITVTAYYSNGSSKTVTDWTTNENFKAAATNKTITIFYTEEGITKSDTLTITIADYRITYNLTETATVLTGHYGTAGSKWTYVQFGDWPQTIKASNVKILERKKLETALFTYYAGSDGNWYVKQSENADSKAKYSDGTAVAQASAGTSKYFKVEPIKWRVLEEKNGKKLLLAENGLMALAYYDADSGTRTIGTETEVYTSNYKHSKVRAWLNGYNYQKGTKNCTDYYNKGFLQIAFTSAAQGKIAMTTVDNSVASTGTSTSSPYICEDTSDKVFLLSYKEANTASYGFSPYNSTTDDLIRKPTDFALATGADNKSSSHGGTWWLRSPYSKIQVWYIGASGNDYTTDVLSWRHNIVVPALWIEQ